MRLFRKRPTEKQLQKLERLLEGKDVTIDRLEKAQLAAAVDGYEARERERSTARKLHEIERAFQDFVWRQAVEGTPEQEALNRYTDLVWNNTAEMVDAIIRDHS